MAAAKSRRAGPFVALLPLLVLSGCFLPAGGANLSHSPPLAAASTHQAAAELAPPSQPAAGGAAPSPGGHAGCGPGSDWAAFEGTIGVDGVERSFLVTTPREAGPGPVDLVIAFHGRTNSNAEVRRYMDLDEALPRALIVYPAALPAAPGTFSWSAPGDPPDGMRDFALFDALLALAHGHPCLSEERTFVVGHSLGASFANALACHRAPVVRAVASVAGGAAYGECGAGTAALLIHHPDDRLVPVGEGVGFRDALLELNGLGAEPVPAEAEELNSLRCLRYGAWDTTPVLWCPHDDATTFGGRYYPHNWPDAAAPAIAVFLSRLP